MEQQSLNISVAKSERSYVEICMLFFVSKHVCNAHIEGFLTRPHISKITTFQEEKN